MIRVDPYFLYQVGAAIRPLITVKSSWTKAQLRGRLFAAEHWIDSLINNSVYKLPLSWSSGNSLLQTVRRLETEYKDLTDKKLEEAVGWLDSYLVESEATTFQTVLAAELQMGMVYVVQPKGGYDLMQLTEYGLAIYPKQLSEKVPEAIPDAKDAARCIAFDLPTAAAFHLHRLHELVLRRYYDTVTKGKERPEKRNIGAYIDALKGAGFKDQKVFGALAGLKNFHRNPVLHPDDRLQDIEEAIALLGSINTVITYMLKAISPGPLTLTPPPSDNETKAIEDQTAQASDATAGDSTDAV
jgi:hypothetical protein